EILGSSPSEIASTATLTRDLAVTSLDFLDLTYRLETHFRLKIPRGPIQYLIQQGLDNAFAANGALTSRALERLRIVMPEADAGAIVPGLKAHEISDLYTAETFVRLVAMAQSARTVASVA